jgi:hypothetical protein
LVKIDLVAKIGLAKIGQAKIGRGRVVPSCRAAALARWWRQLRQPY